MMLHLGANNKGILVRMLGSRRPIWGAFKTQPEGFLTAATGKGTQPLGERTD